MNDLTTTIKTSRDFTFKISKDRFSDFRAHSFSKTVERAFTISGDEATIDLFYKGKRVAMFRSRYSRTSETGVSWYAHVYFNSLAEIGGGKAKTREILDDSTFMECLDFAAAKLLG